MIILPGGAYRPPPDTPWTPGLRPGGREGSRYCPGQYFLLFRPPGRRPGVQGGPWGPVGPPGRMIILIILLSLTSPPA